MTKQLLPYVMSVGMLLSAPTMSAAQAARGRESGHRPGHGRGSGSYEPHGDDSAAGRQGGDPGRAEGGHASRVGQGWRRSHGQLLQLGQHPVEARRRAERLIGSSNRQRRETPARCRAPPEMRQRVATVTITGWDPAHQDREFHTDRTGRPTREHCRTPPTPRSWRVSRWAIA